MAKKPIKSYSPSKMKDKYVGKTDIPKRDQYEENRVATLKTAVQKGMESGIAKTFTAKKHLELLKAGKPKNS